MTIEPRWESTPGETPGGKGSSPRRRGLVTVGLTAGLALAGLAGGSVLVGASDGPSAPTWTWSTDPAASVTAPVDDTEPHVERRAERQAERRAAAEQRVREALEPLVADGTLTDDQLDTVLGRLADQRDEARAARRGAADRPGTADRPGHRRGDGCPDR